MLTNSPFISEPRLMDDAMSTKGSTYAGSVHTSVTFLQLLPPLFIYESVVEILDGKSVKVSSCSTTSARTYVGKRALFSSAESDRSNSATLATASCVISSR